MKTCREARTFDLLIAASLFVLALLIALTIFAAPAEASTGGVVRGYLGAQAATFSGADPYVADAEATASLSASLSPHISVVAGAAWGVCNSYVRGAAGPRVTVTDVDNPDVSVGVGIVYRVASKAVLRPNEWAPDVSFGWRPMPDIYRNLLVVGNGYYGLTTHRAGATLGLRWRFAL